mgnify:CR=1 FL=1
MENIEEKVLELVGKQTGIDPKQIPIDRKFEDLNLDSVAIVELVFSLEETFDISIPLIFDLGLNFKKSYKRNPLPQPISSIFESKGRL